MMNFFSKFKGVIAVLIAVVIAFFVYSYFFTGTPQPVLSSTAPADSNAAVDQDLITLLLTLKNIKLDGTIFSDPVFQSLQDFGKDLVQEPVGRTNPFAPLGTISAASQAGAASSAGAPSIGATK